MLVHFDIIPILMLIIGLTATAFWIWQFIECILHEPNGNKKVLWLIYIAIFHFLGGLSYFLYNFNSRYKAKVVTVINNLKIKIGNH